MIEFALHKRARRAVVRRPRRLRLRIGERLIAHAATDRTPCGCTSHRHEGVEAVEVAWRDGRESYELRCLLCGATWDRPQTEETAADLGIE